MLNLETCHRISNYNKVKEERLKHTIKKNNLHDSQSIPDAICPLIYHLLQKPLLFLLYDDKPDILAKIEP
jgi:hypothetical protein